MNSAHLPEDIPYNEIHEYIIKNAELNKFDYKVSNQIIGIVISELYRSSRDLTKHFRLAVNQDINVQGIMVYQMELLYIIHYLMKIVM